MTRFLQGLPARTIHVAFGVVYVVCLAFALLPPLYLGSSGVRSGVLGLPWSILYWLVDTVVLVLATAALYGIENLRGELLEDLPEDGEPGVSSATSAPVAG